MIREPAEARISEDGRVEIPMGVLVEAGLNVGDSVLVFSDGDGRVVMRRADDAVQSLLDGEGL
ncbi:AbrB/MazE/SpoVT family DNA-binding domain-containing protein [Streptomyces parvus]|uniref:AbrB/MazE/SpoVT family DNA-binding domain-containing protein n=1 Tax=Streptomyces parvus TaxID=66428 RepID=UPI0033FD607A